MTLPRHFFPARLRRADSPGLPNIHEHVSVFYWWASILIVLGALAGWCFHWKAKGRVSSYHDAFSKGDISDWKFFGGSWFVRSGVLGNITGGRGDKAIVGDAGLVDYRVESDVKICSDPRGLHWGDAGLIFRITDPSTGVDSYDGYYAGINLEYRELLFGRGNYSWTLLNVTPLHEQVKPGDWWRLSVATKGCFFDITARRLSSEVKTQTTYFDNECSKKAGAVGVRTFGVQAEWRNFQIMAP